MDDASLRRTGIAEPVSIAEATTAGDHLATTGLSNAAEWHTGVPPRRARLRQVDHMNRGQTRQGLHTSRRHVPNSRTGTRWRAARGALREKVQVTPAALIPRELSMIGHRQFARMQRNLALGIIRLNSPPGGNHRGRSGKLRDRTIRHISRRRRTTRLRRCRKRRRWRRRMAAGMPAAGTPAGSRIKDEPLTGGFARAVSASFRSPAFSPAGRAISRESSDFSTREIPRCASAQDDAQNRAAIIH